MESLVKKRVEINDMQFGFIPGRSATDAIFILRQVHGLSDRIFLVRMIIDKAVFAFLSVYAPQINLKAAEKTGFMMHYRLLL